MTLLEVYSYWMKSGIYTVGSGYGLLPYLLSETQSNSSHIESLHLNISASQVCPGPIAVNLAALCGSNGFNVLSALAAVAGVLTVPVILLFIFNINYKKLTGKLKSSFEFYLLPLVCAILIYSSATLIESEKLKSDFLLYFLAAFLIIFIKLSTIKSMVLLGCIKLVTTYYF